MYSCSSGLFSRSVMRWFATLICSSSTGTRWAKLLWARTSRVSSSIFVSVTACAVAMRCSVRRDVVRVVIITPTTEHPPVIRATMIASMLTPPYRRRGTAPIPPGQGPRTGHTAGQRPRWKSAPPLPSAFGSAVFFPLPGGQRSGSRPAAPR